MIGRRFVAHVTRLSIKYLLFREIGDLRLVLRLLLRSERQFTRIGQHE